MTKRLLFLLVPFAIAACNNEGKDSVEKADSINETRLDTLNNNGTVVAVDESTAEFMVKTADVGMTDVELGELAQKNGANQLVKDFAAMMVRDHQKAGDELKRLAGQKNVTLPNSIGDDHKKKMADLIKKTGKDFDKAYIDLMVDGHQTAIKDFERTATDTKDPDVKAWVEKTLPALRTHLDEAKSIQKAIK